MFNKMTAVAPAITEWPWAPAANIHGRYQAENGVSVTGGNVKTDLLQQETLGAGQANQREWIGNSSNHPWTHATHIRKQ